MADISGESWFKRNHKHRNTAYAIRAPAANRDFRTLTRITAPNPPALPHIRIFNCFADGNKAS